MIYNVNETLAKKKKRRQYPNSLIIINKKNLDVIIEFVVFITDQYHHLNTAATAVVDIRIFFSFISRYESLIIIIMKWRFKFFSSSFFFSTVRLPTSRKKIRINFDNKIENIKKLSLLGWDNYKL